MSWIFAIPPLIYQKKKKRFPLNFNFLWIPGCIWANECETIVFAFHWCFNLMKEDPEGTLWQWDPPGWRMGGCWESDLNESFIVWGRETISRSHLVKTSAPFKGALERTSNYLFISAAASQRYAAVEMLNMLSIARLATKCWWGCSSKTANEGNVLQKSRYLLLLM